MAKLIIHKTANLEVRDRERADRFLALSPEDKMKELCHLIELTFLLGGANNRKKPQGKGLVIKREAHK